MENVSGQISLDILLDMGFSVRDALYIVELIQLHMKLGFDDESVEVRYNPKLLRDIGERKYRLLEKLKMADMSAK